MKELFESSYLSVMSEENDKLRKEIERLNNIINEAINKAKTMKVSLLLDKIDGIEFDSKFINDLFALIGFMEQELKGVDKG